MNKFNEETVIGISMKNFSLYPDKVYMMSRYDKEGRRTEKVELLKEGRLNNES